MAKNHLKRLAMPTTWTTKEKKSVKWIAKTRPGTHSIQTGMPLVVLLREMLNLAGTAREVNRILNDKTVLVDNVKRKDRRFTIGFMDTLSVPELKEHYRISLNSHGKLNLIKIDEKEANTKVCQIKHKKLQNGKTQLTLSDGRNILDNKKSEYKTSDSIVISVPDQKIISHIKFEKGVLVMLTDGKNIGTMGTVEDIKENTVKIKSKIGEFETLKKYCFAVGKNKPVVTVG